MITINQYADLLKVHKSDDLDTNLLKKTVLLNCLKHSSSMVVLLAVVDRIIIFHSRFFLWGGGGGGGS